MDDEAAFSVLGLSYLIQQIYKYRPQKLYAGACHRENHIEVNHNASQPFFVPMEDYNKSEFSFCLIFDE